VGEDRNPVSLADAEVVAEKGCEAIRACVEFRVGVLAPAVHLHERYPVRCQMRPTIQ
jgi:hypothetical protein